MRMLEPGQTISAVHGRQHTRRRAQVSTGQVAGKSMYRGAGMYARTRHVSCAHEMLLV